MYPPIWRPIFRHPRSRKCVLLTVVFDRDDLARYPHPAMAPRALRAATTQALVSDATGQVYPFWPTLVEWPQVRHEWSPTERRWPVASTQVRLTSHASFPHDTIRPGIPPAVYARLDLWSDGVSLENTIPLLAGPVTQGDSERPTAGITLTIENGDTQREVRFPPGDATISLEDFPDAPALVVGSGHRQVIFGPFPDPIPCIQISKDATRWYLCEPAAEVAPSEVQIGGVAVGQYDRPQIRIGRMGGDPTRTYTEIVFPQSAAQSALSGMVTASGGVGLAVDSAPLTLLRDVGGYAISPRAERDFQRISRTFDFNIFLNNSASGVYNLVRDRILPQTDVVMGMHLNRIDTLQLFGDTSEGRVALGQGLWARVDQQTTRTTSETVYNVIEVTYRRNYWQITANDVVTRAAYVIDQNYGGPLGDLMAKSQRLYGRRELTVEAADLISVVGDSLPLGVVSLAEVTARLTALPPRRWTYDCDWPTGMGMWLNSRRFLTDSEQRLVDQPVRVVAWEPRPTGPRVTFETEAAV